MTFAERIEALDIRRVKKNIQIFTNPIARKLLLILSKQDKVDTVFLTMHMGCSYNSYMNSLRIFKRLGIIIRHRGSLPTYSLDKDQLEKILYPINRLK